MLGIVVFFIFFCYNIQTMDDNTKNSFAFMLGREQEIALSELKSVLGCFGICFDIYKITGNAVFANIDNFTEDDAKRIMEALAGTVKIFEIVASTDKDISSQIAQIFEERKTGSYRIPYQVRDDFSASSLEQLKVGGKINFGISYYGKGFSRQNINSIALTAKKKLKDKFSLRYVESRDSFELSTILTLKNNLSTKGIEFGLFENTIGVLVAFNNPEEWNKRDYDKPACDKYSGMVPPKLARMMVNLALGECKEITKSKLQMTNKNQNDQIPNELEIRNLKLEIPQHEVLVVDPFCGSGNILLEALMLGHDVVGSDNSEKAVNDSKANIEWLTEEITKSNPPAGGQMTNKNQNFKMPNAKIFLADATKDSLIRNLKLEIKNYNNAVVVCEPYLGEPKKFKPTYNAAIGEYAKVKELYLSFLRNLSDLSNLTVICLIFPLVETLDGRKFSLFRDSVDEIKKLGYTQACKSFVYGRDYQVVKREIALLKLEAQSTNVRNKSE